MNDLPINEVLADVRTKLSSFNRLVLQAPPGAGKTTALPLSLLDEPWLEGKLIIMLEPRRLAVRSSAARMAELLGEKVGETIGYQIKMDSLKSAKTKILIVTEGILTRKLQADPSLEDVALVIFDEFHERSIHADLSLALCLESQLLLREDLKILVMSATLNTSAISKLLDKAPLIESKGRSFPIESIYLDAKTTVPTKKELPTFIFNLLLQILKNEEGNILVFLPGVGEIKKLEAKLQEAKVLNTLVCGLFGTLSKQEQDRAIQAPPIGKRKVVLSTNIAQTSLTIEGIKIVIDSGLQNTSVFNSSSGINRLLSSFISQDSATQRAGRAGRTSAGKAYHLWHKGKILEKHDMAEILSADLTQLLLELCAWGNEDVHELQWMDLPPVHALTHAKELLQKLGALDKKSRITPYGKQMMGFGLHPRLSHMMIKAKTLKLSYEASLLCVLISEKDIYTSSFRSSDMRERMSLLHEVNQGKNVAHVNMRHCKTILKSAKRLEAKISNNINLEMTGVLLALAYPERISRIRSQKNENYLLANGKGAFLSKEDELFNEEYLVVSDLDGKATSALIYKAASLSKTQIQEYLSELVEEKEVLRWNKEENRVEARKIKALGSVILEEKTMKTPLGDEASLVIIEAIKEEGLSVLTWSAKASSLKDRINFVNFHIKDKFIDLNEEYLLETMSEWLLPYLEGKNSFKSLQNLDVYTILSALLSWEEMQELDTLAPSKLCVASGSNIYIDYEDVNKPILAVRLQEMFGTQSTPTVLNGKIKLMIHLLSPARKPMQITQDLESFWKNTYEDVKKDLRGKYKRHYWPDNPLTAIATSKTKNGCERRQQTSEGLSSNYLRE
ncbi:ATP-dependent helicase HrpB [Sulfurimonas sp. MAG313]|nr:ATP-dependent helicase HrpB [Sulfurimonas sp. MAG313]MDF1881985.1 ATP-dependent helicase HrpB [Sulfurimonas sp. MAG313]